MRAKIEVELCGDLINKEMWPLVTKWLFLEELEDPRTLEERKELMKQVGSKCASITGEQFLILQALLTQERQRAEEGCASAVREICLSAAADEQFSALRGSPSQMGDWYDNEVRASHIDLNRRLGAIETVSEFFKKIEETRFKGGEK